MINLVGNESVLPETMISKTYQHRIVRLNGAETPQAKYQLQVAAIAPGGKLLYRAQWQFQTLKGLRRFLQKHFPDSPVLQETAGVRMQFFVAAAADRAIAASPAFT